MPGIKEKVTITLKKGMNIEIEGIEQFVTIKNIYQNLDYVELTVDDDEALFSRRIPGKHRESGIGRAIRIYTIEL